MEKSVVEWLVSELRKYGSPVPRQYEEQAKEMFEKQIIDGVTFGQNNHTVIISADLEIAEQYYNKTYNEQ
jgi:hypothetical protein